MMLRHTYIFCPVAKVTSCAYRQVKTGFCVTYHFTEFPVSDIQADYMRFIRTRNASYMKYIVVVLFSDTHTHTPTHHTHTLKFISSNNISALHYATFTCTITIHKPNLYPYCTSNLQFFAPNPIPYCPIISEVRLLITTD